MKKRKLFVIYFPVLLVAGQVGVNLLYFIDRGLYLSEGFYLNTFFGTNVFFAIFLMVFTYMFKFCTISRAAAWAELLFAVNYMIVKQDNMYNIMFQLIVGTLALLVTIVYYVKKFPLCRLSLITGFLGSVIQKGSCRKGYEQWERNIKSIYLREHHRKNHHQ